MEKQNNPHTLKLHWFYVFPYYGLPIAEQDSPCFFLRSENETMHVVQPPI